MKKRFVKVLVSMMMIIMILTGCAATGKSECKAVIKEFQNACNTLDINTMLDCIDPEIAEPGRLFISLMGEDPTEILDLFSQGLIFGMNMYGGEAAEIFESFKIEVERIAMENTYAVADCKVSCLVEGEVIESSAEVTMELIGEEWYIVNIYFED